MLEQQLVVGKTYRFTFKSEFERHGAVSSGELTCLHPGNGIFRLQQIATFADVVLAGVDLYSNFFKPLGISSDEYQQYFSGKPANSYEPTYVVRNNDTESVETAVVYDNEKDQNVSIQRKIIGRRGELVESGESHLKRQFFEELCYGNFPIYKLVDAVDPDDVLYVPEKAIKGMPEVGIYEYQDMTMAIKIGYYADPTSLDGMLNCMRERLAIFGIQPLNISLFSADSKWMNPDEYEACKSLQVPGKLVTITDDNASLYVGDLALIEGELKTIVNTKERDDQVAINSLKSAVQILDPRVFLRDMNPYTEQFFESGKEYFLKSENYANNNVEYIKLVEDVDWCPGDVIKHFVATTDTVAAVGKKYYQKVGPSYSQITSNAYDTALEMVTSSNPVFAYYQAYKSCSNLETAVAGTTYYELVNGEFVEKTIAAGANLSTDIYVHTDEYEEADENYIKSNPNEVYYIKDYDESYTQLLITAGTTLPDNLYEVRGYLTLDFASDSAVEMIAKKFEYTNSMNAVTTTELAADDIVGLSLNESNTVRIANGIVQRKYNNRWFEYTYYVPCNEGDVATDRSYYRNNGGTNSFVGYKLDDETNKMIASEFVEDTSVSAGDLLDNSVWQARTIAVVINAVNYKKFSQCAGTIWGETGNIFKETYIKDENLKKNYYALYTEEVRVNAQLIAQNQALKSLNEKLAAENAALKA